MSQQEANEIYGKIIFRDKNFAIRSKYVDDNLRIVVHPIINGEEFSCKGYVLGENALIMKHQPH